MLEMRLAITLFVLFGLVMAPTAAEAAGKSERWTYVLAAGDPMPFVVVGETRVTAKGVDMDLPSWVRFVDIEVADLLGDVAGTYTVYYEDGHVIQVVFCGNARFNLPSGADRLVVRVTDTATYQRLGDCRPHQGTAGELTVKVQDHPFGG